MKRKNVKSYHDKTLVELRTELEKKRRELQKAHLSIQQKEEKNVRKARNLRHKIAQIVTIMRAKQLNEEARL